MMILRGIDASQNQHDIDTEELAHQADFAVFRASRGLDDDVTFNATGTYGGIRRRLFHDARKAGLIVGGYHYLVHGIPGGRQALEFVRVLKRANDAHCDGALCVVFVEHDVQHGSMPTADDVRSFVETFQALVPMQPLFIATNAWYWASHVKMDLQRYDDVYVWLQRWTDTSGRIDLMHTMVPDEWWDVTIGGRKPTLIQYTSQARAGGVRVFASLYRGDRASLARLAEVSLPYARKTSQPSLPKRLITRDYRPHRASDTDDKRKAGKTRLVTIGSLLGVAAVVGAFAYVAMRGGEKTEAIFE